MFQNLHFYNQTAIHDYIEALYQSGHISTVRSKLKVSEHVEVNCNIFVIWQFIAARVPSLSHYSSSRHLYPVCHITVHRATCTQSVTLQFIAPRVPSLSHYSSSRHVYPFCHITVYFFMLTLSLTLILGINGLLLSLHCTCFSFRLPDSTSFIREPQSGRFLGLLFSASNLSALLSDIGFLSVT